MRKYTCIVLVIFFFVLLMVSCRNSQPVYGYEYDERYDSQDFDKAKKAASAEDGFYVINSKTGNIEFVDSVSEKNNVICNMSGCAHDNEKCMAHFSNPGNILLYDEDVYVTADSTSMEGFCALYKVSEDGNLKKEVAVLYEYNVGKEYYFTIHRGSGYLTESNIISKDESATQTIYKTSIKKDKKEKICSITGTGASIEVLFFRGDDMYYSTCIYDEKGNDIYNAYTYNITSDKETRIELPSMKPFPNGKSGNCILYSECDGSYYSFRYNGSGSNNLFKTSLNDKGEYTTTDMNYMYSCTSDSVEVYFEKNYIYMFDNDWENKLEGKTCALNIRTYPTEKNKSQQSKCHIMSREYDASSKLIWADEKKVLIYNEEQKRYIIEMIKKENFDEE